MSGSTRNKLKKPLTDTAVHNAKPAKKPYKGADSGGLHIEIRPTGAKLWRYRYRIAGTENLYALGEYADPQTLGDERVRGTGLSAKELKTEQTRIAEIAKKRRGAGKFTLHEARLERDRCRGLVKQGIHPAQQRKIEALERRHEGANTFQTVAQEWIAQNAPHWTPRTKAQRERLLDREIFPHIGSLPVRSVTPAHVLAILKRLETGAPSFGILAQQVIGATFRLAVSTLRADADPSAPLRGSIKAPPTQHKTPLDAKEIPAFFIALDSYMGGFQTKAAVRLVWFTLVRTNEALQAKWSEFDLDAAVWEIPGGRMKKRTIRPHIVPLPSQAVSLLKRLQAITGDGQYLFPNRTTARRPVAVTLLNKAFSSMGYAGRFSPHGIRTTGSTMLNEMGFNGDWVERQLAHHDRNETRATYNGAKYLEQRREMMQQWADYIDALCAGGKVVRLRQTAA